MAASTHTALPFARCMRYVRLGLSVGRLVAGHRACRHSLTMHACAYGGVVPVARVRGEGQRGAATVDCAAPERDGDSIHRICDRNGWQRTRGSVRGNQPAALLLRL